MARKTFIEFPVRDLTASKAFYAALGFSFNPQLSMAERAMFDVDEGVALILLAEARFAGFVKGAVSDCRSGSQFLLCFSAESKQDVDACYDRAIEAGGSPWLATSEHDDIYCRSFTDIDGHVLEVVWVAESADESPAV